MGLLRGFVFYVDLRGLLATLAVAAAVSYSLLGGAATAGLSEADSTLATGLRERYVVASLPGFEPIPLDDVPGAPRAALTVASIDDHTVYAVRLGSPEVTNESYAIVGPASPLAIGPNVTFAGETLTITGRGPQLGAASTWIEVAPATLDRIAPTTQPLVHVVVYDAASADVDDLEARGFSTVVAPGAVSFFRAGAQQLVGALSMSVAGSAVVVGILGGSYVSLEVRARRAEYATLRMFGGPRLVVRLLLARAAFLSVFGVVAGLALTYVVVRLLRRAQFAAAAFPVDFAQWAVPTILAGAFVGIVPALVGAMRRLRAQELRGPPPRARSSVLRPVLANQRAVIAWTLTCAILAGGLGVLFGVVDAPRQLLENPGSDVIASSQGNPLHGRVSEFLGTHIADVDGFEEASPELYCPTLLGDEPAMLRGVDWDRFSRFEGQSASPGPGLGEILLGSRLAGRLDAAVGDLVRAPSCYGTGVAWLRIARIVSLPGSLGDEAFATLATVRTLSDAQPSDVNLVRIRTSGDRVGTDATVLPAGIEAVSIRTVPEHPAPLQPSTAVVRLINFDPYTRTRQLTLTVNGEEVADAFATLGPESVAEVAIPFEAPLSNPIRLAVNPTTETTPGESAYAIAVEEPMPLGTAVPVRVFGADGQAASGVNVTLDGEGSTTDTAGVANLNATIPGKRSLRAEGTAGFGARVVRVLDPADAERAHLVIRRLGGPATASASGWNGVAYVENVGGRTHSGPLELVVDGNVTSTTHATVGPGATARVELALALAIGSHMIGQAPVTVSVTIFGDQPPGDPDTIPPDVVNDPQRLLELRRERLRGPAAAQEDPLSRFIGDTFQNFDAALTLIVLVTVAHAAFAFLFSVRRELEERAPNLATLLALGATVGQVRMRIVREYGFYAAIAAAVGTALGLLLAQGAAAIGLLVGFGHALSPRFDLVFFLQLTLVSAGVIVVAALVQADSLLRRSHRELRSAGPTRAVRPPLSRLLEPMK